GGEPRVLVLRVEQQRMLVSVDALRKFLLLLQRHALVIIRLLLERPVLRVLGHLVVGRRRVVQLLTLVQGVSQVVLSDLAGGLFVQDDFIRLGRFVEVLFFVGFVAFADKVVGLLGPYSQARHDQYG